MALPSDFLYWPDTAHPSLEPIADELRARMWDREAQSVCIAKMPRIDWVHADECSPAQTLDVRTETLTFHTAATPAPYVGWPFVYTWRVALGEGNRWVAGPVRRQPLPPDWSDPTTWR